MWPEPGQRDLLLHEVRASPKLNWRKREKSDARERRGKRGRCQLLCRELPGRHKSAVLPWPFGWGRRGKPRGLVCWLGLAQGAQRQRRPVDLHRERNLDLGARQGRRLSGLLPGRCGRRRVPRRVGAFAALLARSGALGGRPRRLTGMRAGSLRISSRRALNRGKAEKSREKARQRAGQRDGASTRSTGK